jgi:hypothetical protein
MRQIWCNDKAALVPLEADGSCSGCGHVVEALPVVLTPSEIDAQLDELWIQAPHGTRREDLRQAYNLGVRSAREALGGV